MGTLFVVEPNKAGAEHLSFNIAVLDMLAASAAERRDTLILFCEGVHHEQIRAKLSGRHALAWRQIPVISGFNRRFIKKFLVELAVVLRILVKAKRRHARVVLLSVFPNVLACVLLLRTLFRRVPVYVFLHAELESLLIPSKQKPHKEGFWTRIALLRLFDGFWPVFYVLGDGIRTRLIKAFPSSEQLKMLRSVDHPYLFHPSSPPSRLTDVLAPERRPFKIGFVGTGRSIKGIEEFFRLAEQLAGEVGGAVSFVVVGGLETATLMPPNCHSVEILSDRPAGLDADGFIKAIGDLDCALFLYRQNYRVTASGAVFDVINLGVEILSLPNDYIADLSGDDVEGGIKFFENMSAIEVEIKRRMKDHRGPKRYHYEKIREKHSARARSLLTTEILDSSGSSVFRSADQENS